MLVDDRTVCQNDSALRSRLNELLAAHMRSGEFLDVPAFEQMHEADDWTTRAGAISKSADAVLALLEPSTEEGGLGRLNHYEVLEVIGEGGFGVVLKAFDTRLRRIVAIKMLAPQLADTSPPRKRFLREARAANSRKDRVPSHSPTD